MLNRLTAGELCTRPVVVALRSTPLDEAARQMRSAHVGCLVVVDAVDAERRVAGLLTDRDIVTTLVARDLPPSALRVGDVMTHDVACVREDDSLVDLLATIEARRVRRVPVVGAQQRLVGIVSVDDLLRTLAGQFERLAGAIGEQVKVERVARP